MMVLTFPPVTRLSAIEEAPGWMNCTVEPAGIPKALQVRIALFVVWVITDLVEDGVESVALPACTWKPDSPLEEPADAPLPPHDSPTAIPRSSPSQHHGAGSSSAIAWRGKFSASRKDPLPGSAKARHRAAGRRESSKPHRRIEQHLVPLRSVVAARHRRQGVREFDAGADVVVEPDAHARARRVQREPRAVAASPVPDLRSVVEGVGLDRLDEVLIDTRIVAQLRGAADSIVAAQCRGVISPADLSATEADLLADEQRFEGVLALRRDGDIDRTPDHLSALDGGGDLGEVRVRARPRERGRVVLGGAEARNALRHVE